MFSKLFWTATKISAILIIGLGFGYSFANPEQGAVIIPSCLGAVTLLLTGKNYFQEKEK